MYQNATQMYAGFFAVFVCMCAMAMLHHSNSIVRAKPVQRYSTANATLGIYLQQQRLNLNTSTHFDA
jgi:hypothetical protein